MVFLCLDVTKFKYYISGVDLRRYPEEEVHPCLRREGDTIYLGIYLEGRYSLKEFEHYQRKIQSWLKRHCLGGIAYYGDHSSEGYRLIFIDKEETDEIKDWICKQQ